MPQKPNMKQALSLFRVEVTHKLRELMFMSFGILAATFGLRGFLLPNSFIDGGVVGVSLIVHELTDWHLSVLLVVINLPFLLMGYFSIGRGFAIRSIVAIAGLATVVELVELPAITSDPLLIAVFGGFFLGLGIGLAIRGGAVIDGTEVMAIFIGRRTPLTIGDVILVFNIIIFGVAAYVFDVETALYAILTYLAASRTVDFVVSGIEEYVGVTIVSEKSEEIRQAIIITLGKGCTIYQGKKGYTLEQGNLSPTDIVFTVLTRLELAKLHTEVDKIDPTAFTAMHSVKDVRGGVVKKRPLK